MSEGQPVARLEEEIGKRIEPQRAGALASFVAMQGNDLLKDAPPPERRQPQGYITVESKAEPIRSATGRNRATPSEKRPKTEEGPVDSPDTSLKPHDEQPRRGDVAGGPGNESGDLPRDLDWSRRLKGHFDRRSSQ